MINRDRKQENFDRYQTARGQFSDAVQASIERRERRKAAEAAAAAEAALKAQEAAAQARRDKQLHLYEQQTTGQRANIAGGAAAQDFRYTTERDKQQLKGTLKRDDLQNRATSLRDQQQALEQERSDARKFGYSTQENEQQFGQQMQRDAAQHGYTTERDQLQHGNTLQRDYMQFGLDTKRENQQQRNTIQRDLMQGGIQQQRDQRLNQFDTQRDERQQGYTIQRDQMQQQFTQENMYQRETADVAAKWQEQVQLARNAGLDFSARQQQEMKDLDATFRKNVINGDLDDGLKQQAMLLHQKKLAAIIPEEKVQNPQDSLQQSLMFHEPTQSWYMMGRDSKGFPTFEPLGGPDNQAMEKQQAMQQQAAEKKAAMLRDARFERDEKFMKLVRERQTEVNPITGELVYADRDEAIKAAMDEFAPLEADYRQDGLPPLWAFQKEADEVRAKQEKQAPVNPHRRQPALPKDGGMAGSLQARSGDGSLPQTPAQSQPPVLSHNGQVPDNVREFMRKVPGGDHMMKLRKSHGSNDVKDQTMRMAIDVVVNAIMTGDSSDPDLAESLDIMKRAGVKLGQ